MGHPMLVEFFVILVLVLVNGLFAGAEIALVSIDRVQLSKLMDERPRTGRLIDHLRRDPERLFATVQIVITVVGATAGAFGGATFARDLTPLLVPMFGRHADNVSLALAVGVISYLSLVLGELVPKSLALRHAQGYSRLVAPILTWLTKAAKPLVWFLTQTSNLALLVFGDKTTFTETRLSPAELRLLVDEATRVGSIDAQVGEIASRAFDFSELTAGEVMIPRTRVVGLDRTATVEEVKVAVLEHGHSRLPVYEEDLDRIVGYVHYKDLLGLAWEGRLFVLEDLIRPPYFVSEAMPAATLLHEMRQRRVQLAIVLDEHGGTAGIVTLDDLIEELVGEVFGEVHAKTPPWIRRNDDGSVIVRGDVPIRELNRELELELPEGDTFSTLGGLTMYLAKGVPSTGEHLETEAGVRLIVEKASERSVEFVRVIPPADESRGSSTTLTD